MERVCGSMNCFSWKIVPSTFTIVQSQYAFSHQQLLVHHRNYVNNGYEGTVLKRLSNNHPSGTAEYKKSLYKTGKCSNILKYKDFHDEEALIIGVRDAKLMLVQNNHGQIFTIANTINADLSDLRIIGKKVTYKYGLSREPVAIEIRDYE